MLIVGDQGEIRIPVTGGLHDGGEGGRKEGGRVREGEGGKEGGKGGRREGRRREECEGGRREGGRRVREVKQEGNNSVREYTYTLTTVPCVPAKSTVLPTVPMTYAEVVGKSLVLHITKYDPPRQR